MFQKTMHTWDSYLVAIINVSVNAERSFLMLIKWLKRTLIIIILCPIAYWAISFAQCELLTVQHGQEFKDLYRVNTMIGEQSYLKVLNYSDTYAQVYYVGINRSGGDILGFSKQNDRWVYQKWERTVWSKTGSADDFVWPYIR